MMMEKKQKEMEEEVGKEKWSRSKKRKMLQWDREFFFLEETRKRWLWGGAMNLIHSGEHNIGKGFIDLCGAVPKKKTGGRKEKSKDGFRNQKLLSEFIKKQIWL